MSASMRASDTVRRSTLLQPSLLIDVMFGVTIAGLFSGINTDVGPAKLQFSDVMAAATIFLVGLRSFSAPRASGLLLVFLAAYLLLFVGSAFVVGTANGMKELIQTLLVFSFVFVAFGYYRTRSTERLLIIASVLIVGILIYNIAWHAMQGTYVGWKELNEPKTIFTLLPFLLVLLFSRFGGDRHRFLAFLAVCLAAVVILLSGERKAYLFALVALAIWTAPFNWRHAVAAVFVVPVLLVAGATDRTGYLDRQIQSLSDALGGGSLDTPSLSHLIDDTRPTSMSNAQREITNRLAVAKWEKRPVLGIGTNAFDIAIKQEVSLPETFRAGIHGEFHRALYENGIVGLGLYLALWITAFAKIALAWPMTKAVGDPGLNKIKLLCATMFLIYCAFEASKGLTLVCICVLPFVIALPPRSLTNFRSAPVTTSPFIPVSGRQLLSR